MDTSTHTHKGQSPFPQATAQRCNSIVPPGTFHGDDVVPPGTFHGDDVVPPGTFHGLLSVVARAQGTTAWAAKKNSH